MRHHALMLATVAMMAVGSAFAAAAPSGASALRFDEPYRYDAHDPAAFHGRQNEYDVSQSITFHADGSGSFTSEETARIRWKMDRSGGKDVIHVDGYTDVRDPDGHPTTAVEAGLSPMGFRVSPDGKRLTDVAGGIVYVLGGPARRADGPPRGGGAR